MRIVNLSTKSQTQSLDYRLSILIFGCCKTRVHLSEALESLSIWISQVLDFNLQVRYKTNVLDHVLFDWVVLICWVLRSAYKGSWYFCEILWFYSIGLYLFAGFFALLQYKGSWYFCEILWFYLLILLDVIYVLLNVIKSGDSSMKSLAQIPDKYLCNILVRLSPISTWTNKTRLMTNFFIYDATFANLVNLLKN